MNAISSDKKYSMRQKSAIKRRTTQEHNSNLRAGYVQIDEEQLHKSGLRGRKTCFVYTILILVLIIAGLNLTVLCFILSALRFSFNGPFGIEILSDSPLVRFLAPVQADKLVLVSGVLNGYNDMDLSLAGDQIVIEASAAKLVMDDSHIRITANEFQFQTTDRVTLLSDEHVGVPAVMANLESLHASSVTVNEIVAGRRRDLHLQSDRDVDFRAHAISVDSPFYNFTSLDDIRIETKNILILNGAVRLTGMTHLTSNALHLCLCGKSGKVIASSSCSSLEAKDQCSPPNPS